MSVETIPLIQTKFGNATLNNNGYYRITTNEKKNKGKLLHRVIFEDFYQCDLDEMFPEGVIIHYINGDKTCNEIWNLMPMTNEDHVSMHNTGFKHSEETKRKISKINKGENNYWYGKHLSKEHRKKISDAHIGFIHSEETKRKMSESCKGKTHSLDSKLKMSKNKNKTGFFRVHQMAHKECKQGFTWRYEYYDDTGKRRKMDCVDLNKLKRKVLAKNLIWKVMDMANAKLTCENYGYNLEDLM